LPTPNTLVHGHKARLLNLATRRSKEVRYFDTWMKFFDSSWVDEVPNAGGCHLFNKTIQHLPYGQAHIWNARWTDGKLTIDPVVSGYARELEGTILTPRGPVSIKIVQADHSNGHQPSWKIAEQKSPRGIEVVIAFSKTARTGRPSSHRNKSIRIKSRLAARPALAGQR